MTCCRVTTKSKYQEQAGARGEGLKKVRVPKVHSLNPSQPNKKGRSACSVQAGRGVESLFLLISYSLIMLAGGDRDLPFFTLFAFIFIKV